MRTGINLDLMNPAGAPQAPALRGFGFGRMVFNVSQGTGSDNIQGAFATYDPYLFSIKSQGVTPILVLNHQTYGEGAGYNWEQMSDDNWSSFIARFVDRVRQIAAHYKGWNIVYQLMNEHDHSGPASLYVPPRHYGDLFNYAYGAIKALDRNAVVITGGYVTGPGSGMAHFNNSGITVTDGVAFHPYLASADGRYVYNGVPSINYQISQWAKLNKPLWITEFGVLDRKDDPQELVAAYASAFLNAVPQAVTAVWYAWSHQMHNGYGAEGHPDLMAALTKNSTPPVTTVTGWRKIFNLGAGRNLRVEPSTGSTVLTLVKNDMLVRLHDEVVSDGAYRWVKITLQNGMTGWIATSASLQASVWL